MQKAPDKENDSALGEKITGWEVENLDLANNSTLAKPAAFLIPAWCWAWVEQSWQTKEIALQCI